MLETQLEPQRTATRWDGSGDAVRSRKRRANGYMREALRLLDPDELIPFFCECDRTECFATVWLTGRHFDHVRATSGDELSSHWDVLSVPAGT